MKKEHSARFYILRFLICAALACGAFFYAFTLRRLNLAYTPSETAESSTLLSNPYCGFYKISGYTLSDDFMFSPEFERLYDELTGMVVIWLEENGL